MQIPDVVIATMFLDFAEAASWSQTRQIMLASLRPYLKKKNITADEFFPLPTDEKFQEREELTKEISNEDVKWWKEYVKNYKNKESK